MTRFLAMWTVFFVSSSQCVGSSGFHRVSKKDEIPPQALLQKTMEAVGEKDFKRAGLVVRRMEGIGEAIEKRQKKVLIKPVVEALENKDASGSQKSLMRFGASIIEFLFEKASHEKGERAKAATRAAFMMFKVLEPYLEKKAPDTVEAVKKEFKKAFEAAGKSAEIFASSAKNIDTHLKTALHEEKNTK